MILTYREVTWEWALCTCSPWNCLKWWKFFQPLFIHSTLLSPNTPPPDSALCLARRCRKRAKYQLFYFLGSVLQNSVELETPVFLLVVYATSNNHYLPLFTLFWNIYCYFSLRFIDVNVFCCVVYCWTRSYYHLYSRLYHF